MRKAKHHASYNQPNPQMHGRSERGLRLGWLSWLLLATAFLPSSLSASALGDTARQLAHKIATATGPGAIALDITNRSSLDEKSLREVRSALEAQLRIEGVRTAKADQAMGSVQVTLSESLREYVWSAEIMIGSDEKRIAMVSLPRTQSAGQYNGPGAAGFRLPGVVPGTADESIVRGRLGRRRLDDFPAGSSAGAAPGVRRGEGLGYSWEGFLSLIHI